MNSPLYWLACAAVLVLAVLTGFSIGLFILPIGLALVALGPVRHRPGLYWPPLLAVVGFVIAYVLVVPLTCSTTTVPGGSFDTVCSSILGPDVHLAGTAGPANDAAILAGAAGGVIGAVGGLTLVAARPRRGQ